jgi:hypothetical protein
MPPEATGKTGFFCILQPTGVGCLHDVTLPTLARREEGRPRHGLQDNLHLAATIDCKLSCKKTRSRGRCKICVGLRESNREIHSDPQPRALRSQASHKRFTAFSTASSFFIDLFFACCIRFRAVSFVRTRSAVGEKIPSASARRPRRRRARKSSSKEHGDGRPRSSSRSALWRQSVGLATDKTLKAAISSHSDGRSRYRTS